MRHRILKWLALVVFFAGGFAAAGLLDALLTEAQAQVASKQQYVPAEPDTFIQVPKKPTVEEQLKFFREELQHNWLPKLKELSKDVQKNERAINELEKALEALEKDRWKFAG